MPFAPAIARAALGGALAALLCHAAPLGAQDLYRSFPASQAPAAKEPKSPTTARVMGIVPGLGHLYAGEPRRAALVAGTFLAVLAVGTFTVMMDCLSAWPDPECGSSVFSDVVVPVVAIGTVGFSIWDAGNAAHRTNLRRRLSPRLTVGTAADGAAYRVGLRVGL